MPIKAALLGFGLSGSVFHAPILAGSPHFDLCGIVSSREEEIRKQYPGVPVTPDPVQVMADDTIEVIVITTPNNTHYTLVREALERGKHVLVEKPFTPTGQEALELVHLAEKKGLCLEVYHNRRWDGDFLTVRGLVEKGVLGEIKLFESNFHRFRPTSLNRWKERALPGSGILFDLGSHLVDQALELFGKPEWLQGDVAGLRKNAETDDYFHLTFGYHTMRVVLHSCPFVAGTLPRFSLHGEKGSFVKYGMDPQEARLKEGQDPFSSSWGKDTPGNYGTLIKDGKKGTLETVPGCYPLFYERFAAAITEGAPLPVSSSRGAEVIRFLELAGESARLGKRILLP